ncbi:MAG: SLBB domain-containing protein [Candidatus Polarisedimenticolia bacterium]
MKTILAALALLTAVERSPDGDRIQLTFDAPVSFSQTVSATPPRVTLDVMTSQIPAPLMVKATEVGLAVTPVDEARTRFSLPLPAGMSATVSSSGAVLEIALSPEPLLLHAGPPRGEDAGGIPPAEPDAAGDDPDAGFVIGPEDLIEVNVFELPELKTTTRVLGDGTISLPLLGVLRAAGLTSQGLEMRLRDLLEARFLLNPQVSVDVTEHRSSLVSVIGAVSKPGSYEMIGPRTVMQMISEAGGLTKEYGSQILILRRAAAGSERIELDLEELIIRGNPKLNMAVLPGDIINVPIDRPIYVYVDGAVKNPGQIEGKVSRPITLLQAVARAGGLTERANLRGVHVLRKQADGSQTRIPVDLKDIRKGKADDLLLEEGDVVVIPETFF